MLALSVFNHNFNISCSKTNLSLHICFNARLKEFSTEQHSRKPDNITGCWRSSCGSTRCFHRNERVRFVLYLVCLMCPLFGYFYCQCPWIVHSLLPVRFSITLISCGLKLPFGTPGSIHRLEGVPVQHIGTSMCERVYVVHLVEYLITSPVGRYFWDPTF